MVQSKVELFTERDQLLANWFKALSHPARIQIMRFLSGNQTCFTADITNELPLSRTTINQHLTELKYSI